MGNKLGWIIAAIFGGFVVILIVKVVFFPSPTSPTGNTTAPGMLSFQRPAEPLDLVLGDRSLADGDAGEDYRRALEAYQSNLSAIEEVFDKYAKVAGGNYHLGEDELAPLREVASAVADAAAKKKMTYYFRLTPKKMQVPYYPPQMAEFRDLGRVLQVLATHHRLSGPEGYAKAEEHLLEMFMMGRHLMDERARLDLVRFGVWLQDAACGLLVKLYAKWDKPDRAEQVKRYQEGLWTIRSTYRDLYDLIWRLEPASGGGWSPNAGDIFNLATRHSDRSVRVEAILSLGMVKLTATGRGDQRYVRKLIREKLSSEDELERAAAGCAEALDKAGLERLVGKSST